MHHVLRRSPLCEGCETSGLLLPSSASLAGQSLRRARYIWDLVRKLGVQQTVGACRERRLVATSAAVDVMTARCRLVRSSNASRRTATRHSTRSAYWRISVCFQPRLNPIVSAALKADSASRRSLTIPVFGTNRSATTSTSAVSSGSSTVVPGWLQDAPKRESVGGRARGFRLLHNIEGARCPCALPSWHGPTSFRIPLVYQRLRRQPGFQAGLLTSRPVIAALNIER